MNRLLTLALSLALPAVAAAETSTWVVDSAHSSSQFAVKHLVVSTVRGQFGKTTGKIELDETDPTRSRVEATVDVSTIDTRVPDRDAHLKGPDFFDVAKFPVMTFKSTKVTKGGDGRLQVTGDLTMKGTTKPVTFEVTYAPQAVKGPKGELRRGFTATSKVNRKDFGLNWSKTVEAGPVVSDEVTITVDAEAVRETEKGQAAQSNQAEKPPAANKAAGAKAGAAGPAKP